MKNNNDSAHWTTIKVQPNILEKLLNDKELEVFKLYGINYVRIKVASLIKIARKIVEEAKTIPTLHCYQISKQEEGLPKEVGGYGELNQEEIKLLVDTCALINKNHELKAGDTALFWHLVHIVNNHIKAETNS